MSSGRRKRTGGSGRAAKGPGTANVGAHDVRPRLSSRSPRGGDRLKIIRHDGPGTFLRRAEPWLLGREAENNLVLGLADSLSRSTKGYDPPLYFATIDDGGEVRGCAFRTPPYKLGVTRMPLEAPPLLAADLAEVYDALPAVLGPVEVARAVGAAWSGLAGVRARDGSRQRIHALEQVRFPARVAPGAMRAAEEGDRALLTSWIGSFLEATGLHDERDPGAHAARLTAGGFLVLWVDHAPVSMAAFPARTRNTVRIGYVYTPPEFRRRGYASTLVSHLSRHILDSGFRQCVLYTDLANPTSNRIYREIGYRPVQDVMDVNFPAP